MITNNVQLEYTSKAYDNYCPSQSDTLILSIQSTGLSAKYNYIFLIGVCYYVKNSWYITQWFAENELEEIDIINALLSFANNYKIIITYNGTSYTLPFINSRCINNKIINTISEYDHIDMYLNIRHIQQLLQLNDLKQTTLEKIVDFHRTFNLSSKELISLYSKVRSDISSINIAPITNSNIEDLNGLLNIIPLIKLCGINNINIDTVSTSILKSYDYSGNPKEDLMIKGKLEYSMPIHIRTKINNKSYANSANIICTIKDSEILLLIPITITSLRHYYQNYKDYYFLPNEDSAIHKSLAIYSDKSNRKKATRENCYQNVNAKFIPAPNKCDLPRFKNEYRSPDEYILLNEELLNNTNLIASYIDYILL